MSKFIIMSSHYGDLRVVVYPIYFGVNECILNVRNVNLMYYEFDEVVGECEMPLLV